MAENNDCYKPDKNCGCVGYAFVPVQTLKNTYDVSDALLAGTLFPELNLTIEEYGKVCHSTGGII